MTYEQYKKLKVGDVVSLQRGINKGEKGIVNCVFDTDDRYVCVDFINPNLYNSTLGTTGNTILSYKAFKYEGS